MIEHKYSDDISIYFTPLENGKAEYYVEIHDFGNLECFRDKFDYTTLSDVLNNPKYYMINILERK